MWQQADATPVAPGVRPGPPTRRGGSPATRTRVLAGLLAGLLAAPAAQGAGERLRLRWTPPANHPAGTALRVSGGVPGANELEIAYLFYRTRGASQWQRVEMDLVGADEFSAVVSGADVHLPALQLYVLGLDFLENQHNLLASPQAPLEVRVSATRAGESVPTPSSTLRPSPAGESPAGTDGSDEEPPDEEPEATGDHQTPAVARAHAPGERRPPPAEAWPHDAGSESPVPGAPAAAFVLERLDIVTSGARTLVELLELVPALYVGRDVSGGWHVAAHGVGDDAGLAVEVDGQRLNNLYDGAPCWTLPAWLIERVEVLTGPQSILAGPGASAGLVRVWLLRDAAGLSARARAGTHHSGSDNLGPLRDRPSNVGDYQLDLAGSQRFGGLALNLLGSLTYGSGAQRLISADALTPSGTSAAPLATDDRGWQVAVAQSGDWDGGKAGHLAWGAYLLYEARGPYIGRLDTAGPGSDLRRRLLALTAAHAMTLTRDAELALRASLSHDSVDRLFALTPPGYRTADKNADGLDEVFPLGLLERLAHSTLGGELSLQLALTPSPAQRIEIGVLAGWHKLLGFAYERNADASGAYQAALGSYDLAPGGRFEEAGRARPAVGLYARDLWRPLAELELASGLRFDWVGEMPVGLGQVFGALLTPHLRASYVLPINLRLDLGYDQGLRPPALAERYDLRGVVTGHRGDPTLGATVARQAQLGLEQRGASAIGGYRATLRVFYGWLSGQVYRIYDYPLPQALTVVDLAGPGLDATIRLDLTRSNYLTFAGSWWRRSASAPDAAAGATGLGYITDLPQVTAGLRAHFDLGRLAELTLGALYGSERRPNVRTPGERGQAWSIPQYFRLDGALRSAPLFERVRLGFYVFNLFDSDQRDPAPRPDRIPDLVPRAGFSLLAGLEVE